MPVGTFFYKLKFEYFVTSQRYQKKFYIQYKMFNINFRNVNFLYKYETLR